MGSYRLLIKRSAAKELEAVPKKDRSRIAGKIQRLAADRRPDGSEKLAGEGRHRIRQGNYRILYSIEDTGMTVTVVKIGHRRDVYRK